MPLFSNRPVLAVIVVVVIFLTQLAGMQGAQALVSPAATGTGDSEAPQAKADFPPGPMAYRKTETRTEGGIYLGVQQRNDQVDWNIAGTKDGTNPNILSELTWDDLSVQELTLGFTALIQRRLCLQGYLNYGQIVSGDNQDSDYRADDRREEFSRSNNDAGDGRTFDISMGLGYVLPIPPKALRIIPLAGMSFHQQNLAMSDGYQTITWDNGPPLGPFAGLDSTYEAQWWGPWVGLEINVDIVTGWRALSRVYPYAGLEYHWAVYYAQADWNLRDDFEHPKSFEHEAMGNGIRMMVGIGTQFGRNWCVEVGYTEQQWSAADGTDRLFFSDGTQVETRLNEVNWASRSLGLVLRYQF